MTHQIIKFLVLVFLCFSVLTKAQNLLYQYNKEHDLLKHFTANHLFIDKNNLLSLCQDTLSDRFKYERAHTFLCLNQLNYALKYYKKINQDTLYSSKYYKSYFYLLLKFDSLKLFNQLKINKLHLDINDSIKIYNTINLLENKNIFFSEVPFSVQQAYQNYAFLLQKKAFVAMSISIFLPGMGKTYLGEKWKGLPVFISCISLGLVSLEAYLKDGLQSPRFIISASLFSAVYLSNIFISYKHVFKRRKDHRKQLIYELENYYIPDFRNNALY